MSDAAIALGMLALVAVGVALYWGRTMLGHRRRLDQLDVRVHVNGIRGKSTVTRLAAAVLREGGFTTVAKTTGSAARVIGPRGEETPIRRRGAATINEQVDVVGEHVRDGVDALVIECMAVRPLYQQYAQDFMVRADITIITNVREDHQEEMGETLEQIADSMSLTIPTSGVLITAEDRPNLRERLARNAAARGSRLIYADPDWVSDDDMRGFDHLQFKENVAVGLALARLLDVDRDTAIRGMWKAVPDIGVVRLFHYTIHGKRILWVPLFAANDRESVVLTFERLASYYPRTSTVIGILNNRWDRGRRAELFARMVPGDLASYLDHVVTFGAYEEQVTTTMVELGYGRDRIHNLGESVNPTVDQILDAIVALVRGRDAVLVGMVNIHTHQAELLLEYFARAGSGTPIDELAQSRETARQPRAVERIRRARARARARPQAAAGGEGPQRSVGDGDVPGPPGVIDA